MKILGMSGLYHDSAAAVSSACSGELDNRAFDVFRAVLC